MEYSGNITGSRGKYTSGPVFVGLPSEDHESAQKRSKAESRSENLSLYKWSKMTSLILQQTIRICRQYNEYRLTEDVIREYYTYVLNGLIRLGNSCMRNHHISKADLLIYIEELIVIYRETV